jgi:Rrf2 family protein
MKLSLASQYAVHALAYLATNDDSQPAASQRIAQIQGIPERFLLKVLKALVPIGVLQSLRGPHGGYRLAKEPKQISLLEVIEAVDGPIRGQFSGPPEATHPQLNRRLEKVLNQAAEEVRRKLAGVRLSALLAKD